NPASMALAKGGYLSFHLSSRYVDESGRYLGTTTDFSDSQTGVGDLGLVYKFPTTRGSLVIGGGYSQSSTFNRALSVNALNYKSSISVCSIMSFVCDSLYFSVYYAFAIYHPSPDDDSSESTSFASRDNRYRGIYQNMELAERGQLGEYSAFIAT